MQLYKKELIWEWESKKILVNNGQVVNDDLLLDPFPLLKSLVAGGIYYIAIKTYFINL